MYSIGKLADISNTTIRTLRYYDEIGMLKPSARSDGGHRYYDEGAVTKLYYILTLKELGLELKDIKKIISQQEKSPMELLKIQLELIASEIEQLEKNKQTLHTIIQALEIRGHKNWEDIFNTFKHFSPTDNKIIANREKHFTQEELQVLGSLPKVGENNPIVNKLIELFNTIREAIASQIDPRSEKAQQLAENWNSLLNEMYNGNTAVADKAYRVYKSESDNLGFLYFDEEVISFIEEAFYYRRKGEIYE